MTLSDLTTALEQIIAAYVTTNTEGIVFCDACDCFIDPMGHGDLENGVPCPIGKLAALVQQMKEEP